MDLARCVGQPCLAPKGHGLKWMVEFCLVDVSFNKGDIDVGFEMARPVC